MKETSTQDLSGNSAFDGSHHTVVAAGIGSAGGRPIPAMNHPRATERHPPNDQPFDAIGR